MNHCGSVESKYFAWRHLWATPKKIKIHPRFFSLVNNELDLEDDSQLTCFDPCLTCICGCMSSSHTTREKNVVKFNEIVLNNFELEFLQKCHLLFNDWVTGHLLTNVLRVFMSQTTTISHSTVHQTLFNLFFRF